MTTPTPTFYYNFEASTINGLNLANMASGTPVYDASLSRPGLCIQSDYRISNQQATFNANPNQYITLPSFTSDANGLTFCFWFRTYGCSYWARIFEFGTTNPTSTDSIILALNTTGTANVASAATPGVGQGVNFTTAIYASTSALAQRYINTINLSDNVWRHFAWTISGTPSTGTPGNDGTFSYYLNGQFLYSETGKVPTAVPRNKNFLGLSATYTDPSFNGAIDEFQMYKSVLTAAQIAAIYNGTVANYSVSPQIYANYNDGSNNQIQATTAVATTGLTHYYTFDSATVGGGSFGATNLQNVATGIYDASLSNYTVISTNYYNGAFRNSNYEKPITGRYVTGNGALTLDASGYGGYVTIWSIAATPTNTAGNGMTFCFWMRCGTNPDYTRVFELGNGWPSDNILCDIAQNNLRFYVGQGTVMANGYTMYAVANITDNTWRHITWTIAGTGTTNYANWSVYVNGALVNTVTNVQYGYPAATTRTTNYIGNSAALNGTFNGAIDDFRKYNRVLTSSEIAQIGVINPLYFYYTFEPTTVNGTSLANMATGTASYDATITTSNMITTSDYKTGTASLSLNNPMFYNNTNVVLPNSYPPAGLSSNTTTFSGLAYGNGTYIASASSAYAINEYAYNAFDRTGYHWTPTVASWFSFTTGTTPYLTYTGSVTTDVLSGSITTRYSGEWLQLQMPNAIIIQGYSITTYAPRAPTRFVLAGSNNGTSWNYLDYQDLGNQWSTSGIGQNINFDLYKNTTSYQYYRIIQITSNSDGWGGIGELIFYSAPPQYVTLPSFWTGNNGLTFACWFKSNNNQTYARLFDFGCGGPIGFNGLNNTNGNNNIFAYIDSGKLTVATYYGLTSNNLTTAFQVNDNVWRHMAWTITPDGTWKLYLNGQMIISEINVYPFNVQRYYNYIGKSEWSIDPYFTGGIDDFRMYKSVLQDSDIQALYKGSSLAIHYPFNKETIHGPVIEDLVGIPAQLQTGFVTVTPNNIAASIANPWQTPDGITWTSTASVNSGLSNNIFNNYYSSNCWSVNGVYNTSSTGEYTGTTNTNVVGVGTISGEWIQLQASVPIQFISHNLSVYYEGGGLRYGTLLPRQYYIVGSNDGSIWSPIQYINDINAPISYSSGSTDNRHITRTAQTTTNTSKFTYGIGSVVGNVEVTGFSTSLNYYSYVKIIVMACIGSQMSGVSSAWPNNSCFIDQWAITANASVTQLQNLYSGIVSPNTAPYTTYNANSYAYPMNYWVSNGITWVSTSSSNNSDSTADILSSGGAFAYDFQYHCCWAFVGNSLGNSAAAWQTTANFYDGNTGLCNSYTVSTIVLAPLSQTVSGEWLQINSSVPIRMLTHSLTGAYNNQVNMPKVYYIVGSNDNTNWYPIQYVSRTSANGTGIVPGPLSSTVLGSTATYQNASYTDVTNDGNLVTTTLTSYSTSNNMYTNFRLITTQICASALQTSGDGRVALAKWSITATTDMVSSNYVTGTASLALNKLGISSKQCVTIPTYRFGNNGISISTWFNATSIPANVVATSISSTLFEFGNGWQNSNIVCYFQVNNSVNQLMFGVWNDTTSSSVTNTMDTTVISSVTLGQWYHIVITISPAGTWKIYVNGSLTSTVTNVPYPFDTQRTLNYIGKSSNTSNPYFQGNVDDFRVYKSVIPSDKVSSLYGISSSQELVSTSMEGASGFQNKNIDLSKLYKRHYSNQGGIITTVAGKGTSGYSGDGGLATQAQFAAPIDDIAFDSSNNLYIADSANHRIRRVDAVTGIITTICGNGSTTSTGDDGFASLATINSPVDICIDSLNNIYISEYLGYRIRKISSINGQYSSSSTITTICGTGTATSVSYNGTTSATSATIYYPFGLFIDASFNVYVNEDGGFRVHKINQTTGKITTILGTGTGGSSSDSLTASGTSIQLNKAIGMFVDSSFNFYYGDYGNHRIRKLLYSNGSYTGVITIAGTGTSTNNGDGGLATSAAFANPIGLAIDDVGNIYAASYSTCIRVINSQTGIISTICGDLTTYTAYTGDGGLAVNALVNQVKRCKLDNYGNLYFTDVGNYVVRKITLQNLTSQTVTGYNINGQDINSLYMPSVTTITTGTIMNSPFLTNGQSVLNLEPNINNAIPVPGKIFTSNTLTVNGKSWNISASSASTTRLNDAYKAFNGSITDYWMDGCGNYNASTGYYSSSKNGLTFYIYASYTSTGSTSNGITFSNYLTDGLSGLSLLNSGVTINTSTIDNATNSIITYAASGTYNGGKYTVVWKGTFLSNYTGTWTFSLYSDDYGYLWINGTPVISNVNVATQTGTFYMVAGTYYQIAIYNNNTGGPGDMQLKWSNPNLTLTGDGSSYFINNPFITPVTNNIGIIDTNVNYPVTVSTNFFATVGSPNGISVGGNNTKMVISSGTGGLYYSTSTNNGATWSTPTSFFANAYTSNVASITYDGTRIVYTASAGGAYFIPWTATAPTMSSPTHIGTDTNKYSYFSHSGNGNVLAATTYGNAGGVLYTTWNADTSTYNPFTAIITAQTIFGVALSYDGTRLACANNATGVNSSFVFLWDGTKFPTTYTNSVIGSGDALGNYGRNVAFSRDMNTLYLAAANGTSYSIFVGYWNGTTYTNFNKVQTTVLPLMVEPRCAISNDGTYLYVPKTDLYTLTVTPYSAGEWLQVQLPYPLQLTDYSILNRVMYPQDNAAYREPATWGVMGSNDGTTWYLVDGQNTSPTMGGILRSFQTTSSQAYTYYRLVINQLVAKTLSTNANLCQWNLNGIYTYTDSLIPVVSNYGNVEQLVPCPGVDPTGTSVYSTNNTNVLNYNNQSYIISSSSQHSENAYSNWRAFRNMLSNNVTRDYCYHSAQSGNGGYTQHPYNVDGVYQGGGSGYYFSTDFYGGEQSELTCTMNMTNTYSSPGGFGSTGTYGVATSADNTRMVFVVGTSIRCCAINTNGAWSVLGDIGAGSNYLPVCLTNDGNRLVTGISSGGLVYYATWNGSTYGSLIPTLDTNARTYFGLAINADGSRLVAVAKTSVVYIANWSITSNNYTAFTQTLDTITGRYLIGITMTQSGDRIAYCSNATSINNVYIAYWNGTNYDSGIVTNNTISLSNARSLAFSKDASVLYYSIQAAGSLYAAYYNNITQNYGNFYQIKPYNNAVISSNNRDGYGMYMSPDGSRLYLTSGNTYPMTDMITGNTSLYTANGEWIQVKLARPAKVTSYGFNSRTGCEQRLPRQFVLLGSNDGATWFMVDSRNTQSIFNKTSQGGTANTYSSYPPPFGQYSLSMFAPSTTYASNFYSYYRLVTISLFGDVVVNISQIVMNGVYL